MIGPHARRRVVAPGRKVRNANADLGFSPYAALAFAVLLCAAADCHSCSPAMRLGAQTWLGGPEAGDLCESLGVDPVAVREALTRVA